MFTVCCHHHAAGLTIDNVRKALQGIHWHEVGRMLCIPVSKLQEIDQEYPTDDQCEVAVMRYWTLRDPYASWRRMIEYLECEKKNDQADRIRHYAEELTGIRMTYLHVHVHIHATINVWVCVEGM